MEKPVRVEFALVPGFSLLAVPCAVDALRAANSEIAVGCGFQSASHLGRHLKRRRGTTPGQWRRDSGAAASVRSCALQTSPPENETGRAS